MVVSGEYQLERAEPVLMGVCARFADWVEVSPALVRTNAVLIGLIFAPVAVPAYAVVGLLLGRREIAC